MKPLEEQLHTEGIDCRDFERVADGGVGRRSAPLYKDAVPLAVENDVPDNQEISGKTELGDQLELMLNLGAGLVEQRSLGP